VKIINTYKGDTMKKCRECEIEKNDSLFYGKRKVCKDCYKKRFNSDLNKESCKRYYQKNKQKSQKKYSEKPKPTRFCEVCGCEVGKKRRFCEDCYRIRRNKKQQKRIEKKTIYEKALHAQRKKLANYVKRDSESYTKWAKEYLGCGKKQFIEYIENLFTEGMSWENHGEWHLDHVFPCSKIDASDEEQVKKCFHYSNLQPLWGIDNLRKSDKIISQL
jgi:hypothetical protein